MSSLHRASRLTERDSSQTSSQTSYNSEDENDRDGWFLLEEDGLTAKTSAVDSTAASSAKECDSVESFVMVSRSSRGAVLNVTFKAKCKRDSGSGTDNKKFISTYTPSAHWKLPDKAPLFQLPQSTGHSRDRGRFQSELRKALGVTDLTGELLKRYRLMIWGQKKLEQAPSSGSVYDSSGGQSFSKILDDLKTCWLGNPPIIPVIEATEKVNERVLHPPLLH